MSSIVKIIKNFRKTRPDGNDASGKAAAAEMEISGPTNVSHDWNVKFDPTTREFKGLPPMWTAMLTHAKIR